MTDTERYSDKRMSEPFYAYILFSDHLKGEIAELFAAACEDYPELDWSSSQMGGESFDTRGVTLSTDFGRVEGSDGSTARGETRFIGMPGRCDIDWEPMFDKARFTFPEARAAVARHTDHLQISVGSPKGDTSIAARFDAARRLTCLAAVLAKLPTCVAVYFPNGDTVVEPSKWVEAAAQSIKGEIPIFQWMSMVTALVTGPDERVRRATGSTIGMAAFNGHEIIIPRVPMETPELVQWLYGTIRMLLETDKGFTDSDTLGVEGQDKAFRIRHLPEGKYGAQTDQWVLIHSSSDLDEQGLFGDRTNRPPPPGVDVSVKRDWSALKSRLYAFVAGAEPR